MDYLWQLLSSIKRYISYFSLRDTHNYEDLFYQALYDKKYDEAIQLAKQHKYLDLDLVFKSKWRNSGITLDSINSVLNKIQDKLWVINECVQTVPMSNQACRALIEFGLNQANLRLLYELGNDSTSKKKQPVLDDDVTDEQIEGLIDFFHLNDQQKELLKCQQDLKRFKHALIAYENILDDQQHFDHVVYNEFRNKSPIDACMDHAHDGDIHAVQVMLEFYNEDLSNHLLDILSNFPETLSPYQYRNLLPIGQPYTSEKLTTWFKERALEMESRTLLLLNSIQLLTLGIELKIKNLELLLDDLKEFDWIIYECCSDENIYLSYTDFTAMSQLDRLLLMTGDSLKGCTHKFRFYVIMYLRRREKINKMSLDDKADLLQKYFIRLAHTKEHICRAIYDDLLENITCDNDLAIFTEGLDDILDTIGEDIRTIERNRQAQQFSTLASQTLALGDLNACYETCEMIMKKNYKECWGLCCNLGMHKEFKNIEAKYKLLAFALTYCDDADGKTTAKVLDYIIELRKRDEKLQLAYLKMNMQ